MTRRRKSAKVVLVDGPLDPGTPSKIRYRTAERDGAEVRLRVVNADGPNFAADFYASFAANVRHARRENSALPVDVAIDPKKLTKFIRAVGELLKDDRRKDSISKPD